MTINNIYIWFNIKNPFFFDIELPISPFLAKLILRLNPYHRALVMCKGYNEDYRYFTELVWRDDKELDFYDQETYPEFQLWIR